MKVKKLVKNVRKTINKRSPEILLAVGIVGYGVGIFTACKATTKLPEILDEKDDALFEIEKKVSIGDLDEKEERKEIATVYGKTICKIAKEYTPSAIIVTLSLSSLIGSNNIHRKRNAALSAAYIGLKDRFDLYASRVIEKYGYEAHQEIVHGGKTIEKKEKIIDENGKKKKIKKEIKVRDKNAALASPYAVVFSKRTNPNWSPNHDFNMNFFQSVKDEYTATFRGHKAYTWEEVCTQGMGFSKFDLPIEAHDGGWFYGSDIGDEQIDFDITKYYVVDEEGNVTDEIEYVLDPRVQGDVKKLIWPEK